MHGKGWPHHFMVEHSVFAYMSFLIYVQEKPVNECNGLEKYVREKLREKDIKFFPEKNTFQIQQRGLTTG
jgi:hypothetical protein